MVEKVGEAVSAFKAGDKVVGDNAVACGTCAACKQGNYTEC